ncbi:hypothetical protein TNCT_614091 [Trichonephila clavata]|uniref:Uncharacterized protein n=1 Tax=Trichonephila clavata TaxID=2740835 RepID=A0A8X6HTE6_TRICU|nr:hypothetical protein TNCT_614091 [Trichonephila clavata]
MDSGKKDQNETPMAEEGAASTSNEAASTSEGAASTSNEAASTSEGAASTSTGEPKKPWTMADTLKVHIQGGMILL